MAAKHCTPVMEMQYCDSKSSSSSISEEIAVKKRKTPPVIARTGAKKDSGLDPRFYPKWDCTKPIPSQFFDCITNAIVRAHEAATIPSRGDLGNFSCLPTDIITKIINTDPWTRTRILLCGANRFMRFIAARLSDPRRVLEVSNSPEIKKHCRNYKEVYNAIARAAVTMDSPWVILRFLAAAGDCHNYAGNRYGLPMAVASVELRCLDILRLEFKFGSGIISAHRNPSVAGGVVMNTYCGNVSNMIGALHSCMLRAINLQLENTALGLFSLANQHNKFIEDARRGQGAKFGGNPITYWPEEKEIRTYLRYACNRGLFTLARYLVTHHDAVLAKPKSLIAAPDSTGHADDATPCAAGLCVLDPSESPEARRSRLIEERTKNAPRAREFYEWYIRNAPKYKAIPRPPKRVPVPSSFDPWD